MMGTALEALGISPPHGRIESIDDAERLLRRKGFVADTRRIDATAMTALPSRTLVAARDGGAIGVVTRTSPKTIWVDFGRGERPIRAAEADARLEDRVVVWNDAGPIVSPMRRVAHVVLGDSRARRAIAVVTLATLVMHSLGATTPLLMRRIIGRAIPSWAPHELLLLACGVVVLGLHVFAARYVRRRAIAALEAIMEQAIAREAVSRILNRPLLELEASASELLALGGRATEVAGALGRILVTTIDAVIAVMYLIVLYIISPLACALCVVISGLALVCSLPLSRGTLRIRQRLINASKEQARFLHDVIVGIESVKAAGAETEMARAWSTCLVREQRPGLELRAAADVRGSVQNLADRCIFALVVFAGGLGALQAKHSNADIVASLQAATGWAVVFASMYALPSAVGIAVDHMKRLREMEVVAPSARAPADAYRAPIEEAIPAVAIDGLSYRYAPELPWVLDGFSLAVLRRSKTLLRWPSGRGKTTLLRLIAGLLVPEAGKVHVNGKAAHERRSSVAYLPQSSVLLPLSIRENVRLFSGDASEERIAHALHETGVGEILERLPMGIDTQLTAGSRTLSSGQAHLVLLAAVLASEAEIVLLDEAFANVDGRLQRRILESPLVSERTVLLVTHESARVFGPDWQEVVMTNNNVSRKA